MRRADPEALARYQAYRYRLAKVREIKRAAAVKVRAPTPTEMVREAEKGRITPLTFRNMTRIVNDPKRSAALRVRAANVILKIGYGEPENADG